MNQARSPFMQAVLEAHFPEFEIHSTGVAAVSGTSTLPGVQQIAQEWGITMSKRFSTSLRDEHRFLLESDLVIVAEDSQEQVIYNWGYSGKVVSCEHYMLDEMFVPLDPEGMSLDRARRELAKIASIALRLVNEELGSTGTHRTLSVIPNGSSDFGMALATAQYEAHSRNAILLDADFRAPMEDEFKDAHLSPVYFDVDEVIENGLPVVKENEILVHRRQMEYPERFYLSPRWRKFTKACARDREVVMVTAPRYAKTHTLPDSYIMGALADEFLVVSA